MHPDSYRHNQYYSALRRLTREQFQQHSNIRWFLFCLQILLCKTIRNLKWLSCRACEDLFPSSPSAASTCMCLFGVVSSTASLPTPRIIHGVNKNGFGWRSLTVSCLKPNGQKCTQHRLSCQHPHFFITVHKTSVWPNNFPQIDWNLTCKQLRCRSKHLHLNQTEKLKWVSRLALKQQHFRWFLEVAGHEGAFPGTALSPPSISRGLARQTGRSEAAV